MHTNRRPVPSRAALKVLRQLAYISSGAVCGATALVLEERRRQTCLARKIVENSRRIKQHPRYAHSATAVSAHHNGYVGAGYDEHVFTGSTRGGRDTRRSENDRSTVHRNSSGDKSTQAEALRSEFLPSQVEKGYQRWTARETTRRRSDHTKPNTGTQSGVSNTGHRWGPQSDHDHHGKSKVDHADSVSRVRIQSPDKRGFGVMFRDSKVSLQDQLKAKIADDLGQGKQDLAFQRLSSFWKYRSKDGEESTRILSLLGTGRNDAPRKAFISANPDTSTGGEDGVTALEAPADIAGAIDAFLHLHPTPERRTHAKQSRTDFVVHLAVRAATVGLLREVQSLSFWLDAHNQLSWDLLRKIAEALDHSSSESHNVQAGGNQISALRLVDDLKAAEIDPKQTAASITTSLVLVSFNSGRSAAEHNQLLSSINERAGGDTLLDAFTAACRKLAKSRNVTLAVLLFLRFTAQLPDLQPPIKLAKNLFKIALGAEDLPSCRHILTFLQEQDEPISDDLEELLRLTVHDEDVIELFEAYPMQQQFPSDLYPRIFEAFARSRSGWRMPLFLRRMPAPIDASVLGACLPFWTEILLRQWRRTANWELALGTFHDMRQLAGRGKTDLRLYNVMIKICIEGRHYEEAQVLLNELRTLDGLRPDVGTFSNLILSAARRQDWILADDLMGRIDKNAVSGVPLKELTLMFNQILGMYLPHHSADKMRSIVTDHVARLDIKPNATMFRIVFLALIRDQKFSEISGWMSCMRSLGQQAAVTAMEVQKAMAIYYTNRRPPHKFLHLLLRKLSDEDGGLVTKHTMRLLVDATIYDLRKRSGPGGNSSFREQGLADLDNALKQLTQLEKDSVDSTSQQQDLISLGHAREQPDDIDSEPSNLGKPKPNSTKVAGAAAARNQEMYYQAMKLQSQLSLDRILGHESEAVDMYKETLPASRIPHSAMSLKIAVEASVSANQGDRSQAIELIRDAQQAGQNVTSHAMQLVINRFRYMRKESRAELTNVKRVSSMILGLYEQAEKNQSAPPHYVAVTAAYKMVEFELYDKAIALLRGLASSPLINKRGSFWNTATLTVTLRAYIGLGEQEGASWVVQKLCDSNTLVDRELINEFRRGSKTLRSMNLAGSKGENITAFIKDLDKWRDYFNQRRKEQIRATKEIGWKLIDTLVALAKLPAEEAAKVTSEDTLRRNAQKEMAWSNDSKRRLRARSSHGTKNASFVRPTINPMVLVQDG